MRKQFLLSSETESKTVNHEREKSQSFNERKHLWIRSKFRRFVNKGLKEIKNSDRNQLITFYFGTKSWPVCRKDSVLPPIPYDLVLTSISGVQSSFQGSVGGKEENWFWWIVHFLRMLVMIYLKLMISESGSGFTLFLLHFQFRNDSSTESASRCRVWTCVE